MCAAVRLISCQSKLHVNIWQQQLQKFFCCRSSETRSGRSSGRTSSLPSRNRPNQRQMWDHVSASSP
jgi:hypothetical protein